MTPVKNTMDPKTRDLLLKRKIIGIIKINIAAMVKIAVKSPIETIFQKYFFPSCIPVLKFDSCPSSFFCTDFIKEPLPMNPTTKNPSQIKKIKTPIITTSC